MNNFILIKSNAIRRDDLNYLAFYANEIITEYSLVFASEIYIINLDASSDYELRCITDFLDRNAIPYAKYPQP